MTTPDPFALRAWELVRKERRALAGTSLDLFTKLYLGANCPLAFSRMHEDLLDELGALHKRRGLRLAVAAPRGHAKSTIASLAFVLWCLLYERERLVLIASDTADQANKLLDHVKRQAETNPLLRQDFPELEGARRVKPWREGSILLPNGTMVLSYGANQNLRGARHDRDRPSLIIADDLENRADVIFEEQRHKLSDWFHTTLMNAGTPDTNVVAVGTLLHHDALLAQLVDPAKKPGWTKLRYKAVERFSDRPDLWEFWSQIYRGEEDFRGERGPEAARKLFHLRRRDLLAGTRVLWPQRYGYHDLMVMREREGTAAFQAEMQNEPLDPDACVFANAPLRFWDSEYDSAERLIQALGSGGRFYGACDPSLGRDPTRGDYSAILVLYKSRGSEVKYVIASDIARRTPSQTIDRILHYAQMYRFTRFGVEANQFQQLMVDQLRDRARALGTRIVVEPIESRSAKVQRIASLEAEVTQGLLVFDRKHQLLLEQLRSFPVGKHDDGPDALEMAVEMARKSADRLVVSSFCGRVTYDSEWPPGVGSGKNDRMPDRLGQQW